MIEAGTDERPYPEKGHDRLVLLKDLGRFAVFDGAANPYASSLAASVFEAYHEVERPTSLSVIFEKINFALLKVLGGSLLTTGTAISLEGDEPGQYSFFDFVHAGDSSLYLYDHVFPGLQKLTRDEAPRLVGGRTDARNFLGAPGHKLRQWGTVALPERATIALFTDGVTDGNQRPGGASEAILKEILKAEDSPEHKAQQIISASRIEDDASVIVIEHEV